VRTSADLSDAIRGLVERGREAWERRDYDQARGLLSTALERSVADGDTFGQMAAHHFLGNVAFNECRDEESRAHHLAALALAEADGDPQGVATSLGSLGLVEVVAGDSVAAEAAYDRCVAAYVEAGMPDAAERVRQTAHQLVVERVPVETLVHRRPS
jgi:hypothetical protein